MHRSSPAAQHNHALKALWALSLVCVKKLSLSLTLLSVDVHKRGLLLICSNPHQTSLHVKAVLNMRAGHGQSLQPGSVIAHSAMSAEALAACTGPAPRLRIGTASVLARTRPQWLVFFQVQLSASGFHDMADVATIEPGWLPELAPHMFHYVRDAPRGS